MNLKAFPFFDSLAEMKAVTKNGEPLLCPVTRLLPFQISKPRDNQPIDCINVYRERGTLYRRIMGNEISYDYHQTLDTDFITYYGATLQTPLACGRYYLEIAGRYSAVFSAVNSVEDLVKVEWTNTANLTDTSGKPLVLYQTGWLQRLYLATEITQPAYPYEETGTENEYKEFFADFRRVSKQSQLTTLLVPVYLADALGALPLHDAVHIGPYLDVRQIEVSPEWFDFGTGAAVTVRFSESAPIIALSCDSLLLLETIDTASYTPRGFMCGQPDTNAYWEPTGNVSCEQGPNGNTGYTLVEQRDVNPDSASFNELRTVRGTLNTSMCPVTVTYYSKEQSEWVQRNNCQTGYVGSLVLVKVAAGAYTSTVSQLDADNKALAQLNATKQATANSQGTCELEASYQYIGQVSTRQSTSAQACAQIDYPLAVYSADGTYAHLGGLYTGPGADATRLPSGYYRRYSDGKTMDVWDGTINGLYSCSGSGDEEF